MEIVANETVKRDSFWDFKGQVSCIPGYSLIGSFFNTTAFIKRSVHIPKPTKNIFIIIFINLLSLAEDFVDEWFLMSSPVPVLLITVSYLAFVLKIGPGYMKKRPPFKLSNLLLVYNAIQVLVSVFIFSIGVRILWPVGIVRSSCIVDRDYTKLVATGIYCYFCAKVSELLDTVFFVLRKKDNQITFLHVYHHTLMMILTWTVLKYEPTVNTVFLGTINSFVHVIMYSYYGLSTFPNLAKYLWWKKYITKMQLVQFMAVIIQAAANYDARCPPSYAVFGAIVLNASLFIYLFTNFYVQAYLKNRKDNKNCLNDVSDKIIKNSYSHKLLEKNL